MFNIFEFTKVITNIAKLDRELRANASFGSLYNFVNVKGDVVEIHFTQNLNQSQIDELSGYMGSFSNVSVFDTLSNYLKSEIDPFIMDLLVSIRAENIELGITQANKTLDVLGFFEERFTLPNKTRAVSIKGSLETGSLTVTIEILTYLIANPNLYSDLNPFVTVDRLTIWKNKIIEALS